MKRKTLVLGASTNPSRYSNIAMLRLRAAGYPVLAIGNRPGSVADMVITDQKEDFKDIDTVTLYVNPSRQKEFYDYVVKLAPNRVIFNPGTENPEFYSILQNAKIDVEVACTLVLLATNQY
jgi:predicted CoA-binding protein